MAIATGLKLTNVTITEVPASMVMKIHPMGFNPSALTPEDKRVLNEYIVARDRMPPDDTTSRKVDYDVVRVVNKLLAIGTIPFDVMQSGSYSLPRYSIRLDFTFKSNLNVWGTYSYLGYTDSKDLSADTVFRINKSWVNWNDRIAEQSDVLPSSCLENNMTMLTPTAIFYHEQVRKISDDNVVTLDLRRLLSKGQKPIAAEDHIPMAYFDHTLDAICYYREMANVDHVNFCDEDDDIYDKVINFMYNGCRHPLHTLYEAVDRCKYHAFYGGIDSNLTLGQLSNAFPIDDTVDFQYRPLGERTYPAFHRNIPTYTLMCTCPIILAIIHPLAAIMSEYGITELSGSMRTNTVEPGVKLNKVPWYGITPGLDLISNIFNNVYAGILVNKFEADNNPVHIEFDIDLLAMGNFRITARGFTRVYNIPMYCSNSYSPLIGRQDNLENLHELLSFINDELDIGAALSEFDSPNLD